MPESIERVLKAVEAFKNGDMVILTDHPDRENEGDLMVPAEKITPEIMNFMIRHGSGIVCLAMTEPLLQKLDLPLMVSHHLNTSERGTPFTISIDTKHNITTGVSAHDRVKTVLTAIDDDAQPDDLVRPGHMFPLKADARGVFGRQGHTEGSVDLAVLAGFKPAAVICEIMNPDGTMTHGKDLVKFATEHQIHILAIDDILAYRTFHESLIDEEAETRIHLEKYGEFDLKIVRERNTDKDHLILTKNTPDHQRPLLVRIHSSCSTGDIFGSTRCDCQKQLHYSLDRISNEGGMLIYLNQEGRNIGLFNKIKAYALQDHGYDTVDANLRLGLPADARQYYVAANILRKHDVHTYRLLTNNLSKLENLKNLGFDHIVREPMPVFYNAHNKCYLDTKRDKLNHDYPHHLIHIAKEKLL